MKDKIKFILRLIILFILIFLTSYMVYGIYEENKVRTISKESKIEEENQIQNIKQENKTINKPIIPVPEKYLNYDVDARLEVPKINLSTNVLKKYSTEGLKVCASKYYGPSANEIGNYCIAGHNYKQENMFNHLIDLEKGDKIFLTDNKNGIVEYKVYDKYKVKPQNTNPLSQNTNGKRELTLITCVNYSRNRLVIKAVEE